jgi:hypothetical protein
MGPIKREHRRSTMSSGFDDVTAEARGSLADLAARGLRTVVAVLEVLEEMEHADVETGTFRAPAGTAGFDRREVRLLAALTVAAATMAASRQRCPVKVSGEYADIDEYFERDGTPHHFRCNHTPPHCWDADKKPLDPCPPL